MRQFTRFLGTPRGGFGRVPRIVVSSFLLSAVALSGCVSLLPKPAPADVIYRFENPINFVQASPDAVVVRIDRPGGLSVFETKNILVSSDGRSLSSAAKAKWAELLPLMLQDSMLEYMKETPALTGVVPSSNARTDTRVYLTIKNFEAIFDQGEQSAPLVVVRYSVDLVSASDRKLIGSYETRETVRAEAFRVSAIVNAMEQASGEAMRDIIRWLEAQKLENEQGLG